jgi:hypothetical protein
MKQWAILFAQETGDKPRGPWYVTEGREVLTFPCELNATREGQRLLDEHRLQADRVFVRVYSPLARGEFVGCEPDLTGLTGFLSASRDAERERRRKTR